MQTEYRASQNISNRTRSVTIIEASIIEASTLVFWKIVHKQLDIRGQKRRDRIAHLCESVAHNRMQMRTARMNHTVEIIRFDDATPESCSA